MALAALPLSGEVFKSLVVIATIFLTSCPGSLAETKEFCQWEEFEASCGEEAVLVIHSARYGRMKMGRCLKRDFGYLGCWIDALVELDRVCSGRHDCKFTVTNLHEMEAPSQEKCPKDLTAYLSVTYSCVRVTPCKLGMCQSSDFLKLTEPTGIISSIVTANSACGSSDCPWVLQGQPGQRFNISLIDFSHLDARSWKKGKPHAVCHRYATVQEDEATKDITACTGDAARERNVHLSETNSLRIHLYSSTPESNVHYLIKYSVLGCPNINPPAQAKTERRGDTLEVRCIHSNKAWHLTCDGTAWVGEIGTCSPAKTASSTDGLGFLDSTADSPYGMLIVIALGVALGVAIGVFLLCIVLCYMKRRRRVPEMGKNNHVLVNGCPPPYGSHTNPGMGKSHVRMNGETVPISPSGAVVYTPEHNYTTTLHVKRPLPPNPGPTTGNSMTDDSFIGSGHQTSDTDTILSDDYSIRPGDMQTFKPREHVYETPRFPIQDMNSRRGQMHSADGISRNFLDADDRHGNNRTN